MTEFAFLLKTLSAGLKSMFKNYVLVINGIMTVHSSFHYEMVQQDKFNYSTFSHSSVILDMRNFPTPSVLSLVAM